MNEAPFMCWKWVSSCGWGLTSLYSMSLPCVYAPSVFMSILCIYVSSVWMSCVCLLCVYVSSVCRSPPCVYAPPLCMPTLCGCLPRMCMLSELKGHAVAQTPTGLARAFLYIVRALSLLPSSSIIQIFYHTFHRRAYLLKEHFILSYSYHRWPHVPPPPPAKRKSLAEGQNATWPCYDYQWSINSNQMWPDTIQ